MRLLDIYARIWLDKMSIFYYENSKVFTHQCECAIPPTIYSVYSYCLSLQLAFAFYDHISRRIRRSILDLRLPFLAQGPPSTSHSPKRSSAISALESRPFVSQLRYILDALIWQVYTYVEFYNILDRI